MPSVTAPAIRQRMGLIVGPALTCGSDWAAKLQQAIAPESRLLNTLALTTELTKSVDPKAVRAKITNFLSEQTPSANLEAIAEGRWQAILSFAHDQRLEEAYTKHINRTSATATLDKVWPLSRATISGSIPAFKLLGPTYADDFVVNQAGLLRAKRHWPTVCSDALDATKNAPYLCIGLEGVEDLFFELVANFNPSRLPKFLFQSSDPLRSSATLKDLLGENIVTFDGSIGELIRLAKPTTASAAAQAGSRYPKLDEFSESVICINNHSHEKTSRSEHNRLLQLHFSPNPKEWDSYRHQIDFERTTGKEIASEVKTLLGASRKDNRCIAITGPSATGKSVILRRIAYDAQASGHMVLWARQTLMPQTKAFVDDLASAIASSKPTQSVLVCIDDPVSLGTLRAASLASTTTSDRLTARADETGSGRG